MTIHIDPTTQQLVDAFLQFRKVDFHTPVVGGCSPAELRLLFYLRRRMQAGTPAMKISEISRQLRVTSPTVTQLLKPLEAADLVRRHTDESDRRVVYVQLTERGEQIAQQAVDSFVETVHGLIEYLGEERSHQLAELLTSLFTYLQNKSGAGTREAGREEVGA